MTTKKTWVWITVIFALLTFIIYWLSQGRPEPYPPYLSESPSQTGVKAFYTLLDERGGEPLRWDSEPGRLPEENGNKILLMIEPFSTVSGAEMRQYQDWMKKGNRIWLVKNNPVGYFDTQVDYGVLPAGETTVEDENGRTYTVEIQQEHRLKTKESDEVLLSDDQGVLAFERSYGEGALIVGMNPDWFTNGWITDHEHYEVITSILESGAGFSSIWFDEYIHGQDGFFSGVDVYPKWLVVFVLQLALFVLFFLWMQGKRFGPSFMPREAVVRFGDERLRALAAWYRKGEFYRESLAVQESYIRQLLQERFGVSSQASWQDIRHTLSYRLSDEDYQDWDKWTRTVEPLENLTDVDKKTFVDWSHTFDQMRKEVQGS
ncbi:DUF4350 domain-containing protein [Halobacillus sp. GSS1]|uniref:DUF4350 domain-containing protein n=1 Tax=Halobacillus sp. GSS1 TaxID=2815919 RepID=UPI001A8C0465|nr:DUF4350 domain-containing protein [Halobacillus sp. GSS1]MBN9654493.1 DUF4350 domain-containing protein [Halobacillus sp. GSS1]